MTLAADSLYLWNVFWLVLILVPLVLIWAFAIVDVLRRDDVGGWLTAFWVVVIILVPFLGTLVYLLLRPAGTHGERAAGRY